MAKGASIKLQHYGLDHYFDFGGFGDQHIERDRVAQQALLETHQRWGEEVAAEQIFVIGDTPAGIRCGQAIGANTVGVCTGKYSATELNAESAHLVLEDFSAADPITGQTQCVSSAKSEADSGSLSKQGGSFLHPPPWRWEKAELFESVQL